VLFTAERFFPFEKTYKSYTGSTSHRAVRKLFSQDNKLYVVAIGGITKVTSAILMVFEYSGVHE